MKDDIAIEAKNVSKDFILPHKKRGSIKSFFVNPFSKFDLEKQHALHDVSFQVKKGEFFGIVGRNGSGKSTLLKCMAGVYSLDKGHIKVNGSLVPFIELGVGFNPELSGRDNVYLNGALLGFSRPEIDAMYQEIVDFAELEKFMDQKLKNYSSGMQVRLAFSIAIKAEGDILVLDEVLAVGDTIFQQKCFNYFAQLKKESKTVILVSHDVNALKQYCTNGILIEDGKILGGGFIEEVLEGYTTLVSKKEAENIESAKNKSGSDVSRKGIGKVRIEKLSVQDNNKDKYVFGDKDEEIIIQAIFEANEDVESPVYGITIKNTLGTAIFATNNLWTNQKSQNLSKGAVQKIIWKIPNVFNTGEFHISPAVADQYGKIVYGRIENMATFKIRKNINSSALTNPVHKTNLSLPKNK